VRFDKVVDLRPGRKLVADGNGQLSLQRLQAIGRHRIPFAVLGELLLGLLEDVLKVLNEDRFRGNPWMGESCFSAELGALKNVSHNAGCFCKLFV